MSNQQASAKGWTLLNSETGDAYMPHKSKFSKLCCIMLYKEDRHYHNATASAMQTTTENSDNDQPDPQIPSSIIADTSIENVLAQFALFSEDGQMLPPSPFPPRFLSQLLRLVERRSPEVFEQRYAQKTKTVSFYDNGKTYQTADNIPADGFDKSRQPIFIAGDSTMLIFVLPAQKCTLLTSANNEKKYQFHISMPNLLFVFNAPEPSGHLSEVETPPVSLYVYAIRSLPKTLRNPSAMMETLAYEAPLPNIYKDSKVCMGDVKYNFPKQCPYARGMAIILHKFFCSQFTSYLNTPGIIRLLTHIAKNAGTNDAAALSDGTLPPIADLLQYLEDNSGHIQWQSPDIYGKPAGTISEIIKSLKK